MFVAHHEIRLRPFVYAKMAFRMATIAFLPAPRQYAAGAVRGEAIRSFASARVGFVLCAQPFQLGAMAFEARRECFDVLR